MALKALRNWIDQFKPAFPPRLASGGGQGEDLLGLEKEVEAALKRRRSPSRNGRSLGGKEEEERTERQPEGRVSTASRGARRPTHPNTDEDEWEQESLQSVAGRSVGG